MRMRKRLNMFQRLSVGLIGIIAVVSILLTGGFCFYYKARAERSVSDSINQLSEVNTLNISNAFNRIEVAAKSLGTSTSGLRENMILYQGDPDSLLNAFAQTRDTVNNYLSIALRSITTQYQVYFLPDASFGLYGRLWPLRMPEVLFSSTTGVCSDVELRDEEWYQYVQQSPNESYWFCRTEQPGTLYMARRLQYWTMIDGKAENVSLGVLLIAMEASWISDRVDFSALGVDARYWLMNRTGRVLYAQDTALCGQRFEALAGQPWAEVDRAVDYLTLAGTRYSIHVTRTDPDMRLITLVPQVELVQNSARVFYLFGAVLALVLFVGVLLSLAFSRRITNPILDLAQHMRSKQLTPRPVPSGADDDVQALYLSFNKLVEQVNQSIAAQLRHAQREKELELNVLQAQINPHFLCNSLNSVYNLATLHGEKEIANATSELCAFLRYNISAPDIEISLQRELEMIECYISLQNFLCGDKIYFDSDMQVDTELTHIPKMLLQPLVENCIKHGFCDGFVEICCTCRATADRLVIEVADQGTRADIDAINAYLRQPMDKEPDRPHGFGIRNVNQRIQMKYGAEYGLHFARSASGGTAACIELPRRMAAPLQESRGPQTFPYLSPDQKHIILPPQH